MAAPRKTRVGAAVLWGIWAAVTTLLAFEFPTGAIVLGLAGLGLTRLLRAWPEGAASLGGAGVVCMLVGVLNIGGARSCSPGQASSCGGVAPLPLLVVGALLIATAVGILYSAKIRHAHR